jgi:Ala-tRNA(Pro) deacylase
MSAAKLKQFLDAHGICYQTIPHHLSYTAQETAASAHIHGRELAKTVVVKIDGRLAMAVLPAPRKIDLERLQGAIGARNVALAHEREFQNVFPDCEVGAMPPFGNLYDLPVFVDPSLAEDKQISFNAGTHEELIQMDYRDFERPVAPTVAGLAWEVQLAV